MKTSIILIILIFVNTSALIAEPIAQTLSGVNKWLFVVFEIILVMVYYVNGIILDIRKIAKLDLNNLNLFVLRGKKSA